MRIMAPKTLEISLLFRILLPLLFLLAVGIAPRPEPLEHNFQEARLALRSGDYTKAAKHLADLAQDQPWQSQLWEEAGRAALNAGDIQAAIQYFEAAHKKNLLSFDGQLLLGDAYNFAGAPERANQVWSSLLENTPEPSPGLYLRLADNQRRSGDINGTTQTLRALLARYPGQTAAVYQLAVLLSATDPEAALPYLEQAAELNPELAETTAELKRVIRSAGFEETPTYSLIAAGRALANLQEWQLADLAFEQAVARRPDYAEAWAYLGHAQERLGEDGLSALEQALELDPASVSANLFTALHYAQENRPEMALVHLHIAADLEPRRAEIEIEIGNILAELGDLGSALRHYQRALELAGRQPEIWQKTAKFALRYNLEVRELALPAAREAVLLAPEDPSALDTLGQVYFKLGDPLSARRFFRRALQQDAGFVPAHLHMGMVALLEGDRSAALERFKWVQLLGPDTPEADQAERLVQQTIP